MRSSRSDDAVIRVYDGAGNVIETHQRTSDFKEPEAFRRIRSNFALQTGFAWNRGKFSAQPRKSPLPSRDLQA